LDNHPTGERIVRKAGWFKSAVLGVALFCAMVLYTQFRSGYQSTGNRWQIALADASTMFNTSISYFMVVDRVPELRPYWYGASLTTPVLLFIPSVMLPGKYDLMSGSRRFVKEYYDQNQDATTADGFDLTAEAYLNFGVVGIVVWMFFFGLLNESLGLRARSHHATNFFTVLYIIYLMYFMPFAWKSGATEGLVYVSVKVGLLTLIVSSIARGREKMSSKAVHVANDYSVK
jgi:hypothetical protein